MTNFFLGGFAAILLAVALVIDRRMTNLLLGCFAAFLLAVALVIAWLLGITLLYPNGALAAHIIERADIVKAHIDFLMMAQFLILFFVGFHLLELVPPAWLVGCICFGAFANPLGFLMRGLREKPIVPVEPHFPAMALLSFSLTTLGFLGAIFLILHASWKAWSARRFA